MTSFICPEPLVYTYTDSDTVLWVYEEGNCASPCPTLTYSNHEWEFLKVIVLVLAVLSFVSTSIALVVLISDFSKLFMRAMFILGFLVSSIISMAFFVQNRHDDVVCNGEGHFVKQNPFCVFHAATVVFLFLWVESWSVLLAFDTYLHIVSRMSLDKMNILRRRYVIVTVIFCTCMTAIPLIGGNLGFDPKANLPFCLYLYSDNKWYFWLTLFSPFIVLNSVCLIITLAGASRIHRIFVLTRNYTSRNGEAAGVSSGGSGTGTSMPSMPAQGTGISAASGSPKRKVYNGEDDDADEDGSDASGSEYDDASEGASSYRSSNLYPSILSKTRMSLGASSSSDARQAMREPLVSAGDSLETGPRNRSNSQRQSHASSARNPFGQSGATSMRPPRSAQEDRDSFSDSINHPHEAWRSSLGMPLSEGDDEYLHEGDKFGVSREGGSTATGLSQSQARPVTALSPSSLADAGLGDTYNSSRKRMVSTATGGDDSSDYRHTEGSVAGGSVAGGEEGWRWRFGLSRRILRKGTENLTLLKESLRYNGRSILFVAVFCLTTMYIAPSLLYINAVKYDHYIDGTEDFAVCLVQASFEAPEQTQQAVNEYAQAKCGTVPNVRAPKWQVSGTRSRYVLHSVLPFLPFYI
jgi:hypothetical protein